MDNQLKASNKMVSEKGTVPFGSIRPGSPQSADSAKSAQSPTILSLKDALKLYYPMLVLAAAIEVLLWVHWNSLVEIASWWDEPKYSHGYLVPLCAGMLLYLWRDEKSPVARRLAYLGSGLLASGVVLCLVPWLLSEHSLAILGGTISSGGAWVACGVALTVAGAALLIQQRIDFDSVPLADRWIGLAIMLAAEAIRYWATVRSLLTPERVPFVIALVGAFVMVGGRKVLRWAGWPLAFLLFMLPLPDVIDSHISSRLQTAATAASTFLLQTFGIAAVQDGHDIYVGTSATSMTVAEACSGLSMLTIFGALSVAVALLSPHRPIWQRITIVASAVPIAHCGEHCADYGHRRTVHVLYWGSARTSENGPRLGGIGGDDADGAGPDVLGIPDSRPFVHRRRGSAVTCSPVAAAGRARTRRRKPADVAADATAASEHRSAGGSRAARAADTSGATSPTGQKATAITPRPAGCSKPMTRCQKTTRLQHSETSRGVQLSRQLSVMSTNRDGGPAGPQFATQRLLSPTALKLLAFRNANLRASPDVGGLTICLSSTIALLAALGATLT